MHCSMYSLQLPRDDYKFFGKSKDICRFLTAQGRGQRPFMLFKGQLYSPSYIY